MNDQSGENYSFCPKCGALMENGVCPECTKKNDQGVYSSQYYPQDPSEQSSGSTDGAGVCGNPPVPYQGQSYNPPDYQGQPGAGYGGQGCQGQQNQYYGGPGCQGQPGYQGQPGSNPYGGSGYQGQPDSNPYGGAGHQGQPGSNPYGGQGYQGWQNQYYGGPGWQSQPGPGYGLPNYQNQYDPYMKPKKDTNVWLIVGIVAGVVILFAMLVGSYFYGYFITKYASEMTGTTDWYAGEYDFGDYEDYDGPEAYVPYEKDGEDETYTPSPDDQYYYGPCDAIDENVEYSFVTKSYTNEDPDNDIDVVINYFELKGNSIPNIDQLNEALETVALYYAVDFPQHSYYAEYGESYAVYTTTYVTYNDEDMISLVMDEYVIVDDEYHVDLYPINIDVKNGVVLDNGSLLRIDSEFAREFRRRNNEQNGNIDYLDSLSDEELAEALRDKQSVIAYYTPLGMEVGLNYSGAGSSGWVTVTYKDYENYLMKF